MLILYPATLLNSFISSSSFCVESLGLHLHIMPILPLPFQFRYFISFSHMIAMTRNTNIKLNRSGESRYPCLHPDFSRKTFSLSLLSIILVVGLS